MLLELRTRVDAEGGDWWKWQIGKFDRSRKDMEKLMRMASADEPGRRCRPSARGHGRA
jgi:hypothetical protein